MPTAAYSLAWLPAVLKNAGLKVALAPGWQTRGLGDVGPTYGVLCHHTATLARNQNMPTYGTLLHGRSDLRGPLAQLGLGRDGTYYVIAAGRCNHAGRGYWQGITEGNTHLIGIEAENTGGHNDFPWPAGQLNAYHRGVAAILRHLGRGAEFCAGHKEYALPKGRKTDPDFDMVAFRAAVTRLLDGTAPPPVLIPAEEPTAAPGLSARRPTLRRGASGNWVRQLQAKVGVEADGSFEAGTKAALRAFQRANSLVADDIAGPATWRALDAAGKTTP
ncbi:MAG: peptidoglycan recognition protein family protein [Janthinobacterium lividum]